MKAIRVFVSLLFLVAACASFAHAQRLGSVYFGMGSAYDSASKDPGIQSLITPDTPPKLGGVFGTIGGAMMVKPKLGIGFNAGFRLNQGDYSPFNGLKYRPVFYDVNAVWEPAGSSSTVVPEFQGGIGGANMKFYLNQTSSSPLFGSQKSNVLLSSQNFFQAHASAAVRIYISKNVFIRPVLDYHWVRNFTQFGRNHVLSYGAGIGYSFGQP